MQQRSCFAFVRTGGSQSCVQSIYLQAESVKIAANSNKEINYIYLKYFCFLDIYSSFMQKYN